jgi:hypothetical protein
MKKLLVTIMIGLFFTGCAGYSERSAMSGPRVAPSPCRWTSNGIECDGNRDGTVDLLIKKSDGSVEINGSTVDSQAGTKCENLADVTAALAGSATHLVVTGTVTLTGALELTKPVYVMAGGSFVTDGHLLTLSSSYDAGRYTTLVTNSDGSEISGLYEAKVEWFGAVGDDSTDNTTAIQTAQASIYGSTNYRSVLSFGPGIFQHNNITIYGTHWELNGATLKNVHATADGITVEDPVNVWSYPGSISGGQILSSSTGYAIHYNTQSQFTISNIYSLNLTGGWIKIGTWATNTAYGLTVKDCKLENAYRGIFGIGSSTNSCEVNAINIIRNEIKGCTNGPAIQLWGRVINIDSNIIQDNTEEGILISVDGAGATANYATEMLNITNNYFESNSLGHIKMVGDYDTGDSPTSLNTVLNFRIDGNRYYGAHTVDADIVFYATNGAATGYNAFREGYIGREHHYSYASEDKIAFGNTVKKDCIVHLGTEDFTYVAAGDGNSFYTPNLQYFSGVSGNQQPTFVPAKFLGGDGTPYGVLTPSWFGQTYYDYTNKMYWKAWDKNANTDWVPLGSADQHLDLTTDTVLTEAQIQANKYITNQGDSDELDVTLPAVSYIISVTFISSEDDVIEINPPSGEAFDLNGTTLDADDCVDSPDPNVVGSKIVATRMQNAAGTWIWSLDTVRGSWVDTGASD